MSPGGAVPSAVVDSWQIQSYSNACLSKLNCLVGGVGGLGLLTAAWLHACSAGCLALLGRSGRAAAGPGLSALQASSALVLMARSDVGLAEDAALPGQLARQAGCRLGAFVHAAGIQVSCCLHHFLSALQSSSLFTDVPTTTTTRACLALLDGLFWFGFSMIVCGRWKGACCSRPSAASGLPWHPKLELLSTLPCWPRCLEQLAA